MIGHGVRRPQARPLRTARPDLRADPTDLGSLNTCQLVYLAAAVSPLGLDLPEPVLPLGDSGQSLALRSLLAEVGVTAMGGETTECRSLDDAPAISVRRRSKNPADFTPRPAGNSPNCRWG